MGIMRTDGMMFMQLDQKFGRLELNMLGRFYEQGSFPTFSADYHGKDSVTSFKVEASTMYSLGYTHQVTPSVAIGTNLDYDSMSFWTSQSVALRYAHSFYQSAGLKIPTAVTGLEVATLDHKEQSLSTKKPNETLFESLHRNIGAVSLFHWRTFSDRYSGVGQFKVSKEGSSK